MLKAVEGEPKEISKSKKRSEMHTAVESQRVCDKPLLFFATQGGNNIAKKKRKSKSNYVLEERYVPQRQGVGLND